MPTPNDTTVTDEEQVKNDNTRFEELNKKSEAERTDEEKKELGELKERYGKRMQSKIDKLTWESKTAKEQLEEEKRKREELEEKIRDIENKPAEKPVVKDEFVEIAGKKYYTDEALIAMIQSKEITDAEAYAYQRKRDKEEIKEDLRKEHESHTKIESEREIRRKDAEEVKSQYPQFSKDNPNFNPEDPLYKKALELWAEGYNQNPRGLSLSIKRAKEILRITNTPIDRSDDLGMEGSEPSTRGEKEKEITLLEDEKNAAVRMYCRGDVVNPKTRRPYTESEALIRALEAKKARINR